MMVGESRHARYVKRLPLFRGLDAVRFRQRFLGCGKLIHTAGDISARQKPASAMAAKIRWHCLTESPMPYSSRMWAERERPSTAVVVMGCNESF